MRALIDSIHFELHVSSGGHLLVYLLSCTPTFCGGVVLVKAGYDSRVRFADIVAVAFVAVNTVDTVRLLRFSECVLWTNQLVGDRLRYDNHRTPI